MEKFWTLALATITASFVTVCSKINLDVNVQQGNFSEEMQIIVDASTEQFLVFDVSTDNNTAIGPYYIQAWTNSESTESRVRVVVKDHFDILSWSVPLVLPAFEGNHTAYFYKTARTLCDLNLLQTRKPNFETSETFTVSLSTSSYTNVNLYVEKRSDFLITNNVWYTTQVSPAEPQYFFYKLGTDKTGTILIKFNSSNDVCLSASIQAKHCPIFDLDTDIAYGGIHATVNRHGAFRIRRKDYPDGFFLVFAEKVDSYECVEKLKPFPFNAVRSENNKTIIHFTVIEDMDDKRYITVIVVTTFVLFGISILLSFFLVKCQLRIDKILERYEAIPPHVNSERGGSRPYLADLCQTANNDNNSRKTYMWYTLVTAFFYGIPVVQLTSTYQIIINRTGNTDVCYYNFLCAHPVGLISDFNHFFSNIGYIIMGILFLFVVRFYHVCRKENRSTGVPVDYDIFYAMGIALVCEGIFSAVYHLCPTQSNFQFDTSFMYVIVILCLVKLYQNRHFDKTPLAEYTFFYLGLIVFFAMLGILIDKLASTIIFTFIIAFLYIILCVASSDRSFRCSKDQDEDRRILGCNLDFVLLICRIIILIAGAILCITGVIDFATFLLILLMGNAILYILAYFIMKWCHEEFIWCCCAPRCGCCCSPELLIVSLLTLSIGFWIAAGYFFFSGNTEWAVSPAKSREKNHECIAFSFYDNHDMWHFLSAFGLFYTLLLLLFIDNNVRKRNRSKLDVF